MGKGSQTRRGTSVCVWEELRRGRGPQATRWHTAAPRTSSPASAAHGAAWVCAGHTGPLCQGTPSPVLAPWARTAPWDAYSKRGHGADTGLPHADVWLALRWQVVQLTCEDKLIQRKQTQLFKPRELCATVLSSFLGGVCLMCDLSLAFYQLEAHLSGSRVSTLFHSPCVSLFQGNI